MNIQNLNNINSPKGRSSRVVNRLLTKNKEKLRKSALDAKNSKKSFNNGNELIYNILR